MRLLVIAGWYKTGKSPYSGQFFIAQTKALHRAGYDVVMIVPGVLGLRDTFDGSAWKYRKKIEDGIPVLYLRIPGLMLHRIPAFFDIVWRLTTSYLYKIVLRDFGTPDIIHAHHAMTAGIQALRLRSAKGFPRVVVTEHSSLFLEKSLRRTDAKRIEKVVEHADKFICVSDGLRKSIENLLGKGSTGMVTIPNMVSKAFFEIPLKAKRRKTDKFTFTSCGNLVSVKGYEFLLKSFASAVDHGMEANLVIIGSGPMKDQLAALAERLGIIDKIEFTGSLAPADVARRLVECDCFCSTSLLETFGIAMCEALACGLPLLATDTAGARSIVQEGNNGHMVLERSEDDFSLWLRSFARRQIVFDAEKLRADAYSHYSESSIVRSLGSVYEDCLSRTLHA